MGKRARLEIGTFEKEGPEQNRALYPGVYRSDSDDREGEKGLDKLGDIRPFTDIERDSREVDLRDQIRLPPVRDQDETACCSAFALAALLEVWAHEDFGKALNLASGWMHGCVGERQFNQSIHFPVLGKRIIDENIPCLSANFLDWRDVTCDRDGCLIAPKITPMKKNYTSNIVKKLLFYGQPLVTGMFYNEDFEEWSTSASYVIELGEQQYEHAILLIGYDEENWICRNSFGSDWGGS